METIMIEPQVSAKEKEQAPQSILDQKLLEDAPKAIENSKERRAAKDFSGGRLDVAIRSLRNRDLHQTNEFFDLIVEQLRCDCKVIRGTAEKEPLVMLFEYTYDDLSSWEASESYVLLNDMKEQFPDRFAIVNSEVLTPIKAYYEALNRNAKTDIVILYDGKHSCEAVDLYNELNYDSVQAFDISNIKTYNDPDLLCALHHAAFMVLFCPSVHDGEKNIRTQQFRAHAQELEKRVLFVTDQQEQTNDHISVSLCDENWIEQIHAKATVLIDGAPSKEGFIKTLLKREEAILQLTQSHVISDENQQKLHNMLENQIADLEDFEILYGGDIPCIYDAEALDALEAHYHLQATQTKNNIHRWLNQLIRNDHHIKTILENKHPFRFFERYNRLCKLIEAQQKHLDQLLTHYSLDELKQMAGDVILDRYALFSIRRQYQQDFKDVYLEKFMRPFDKIFSECVALDRIKPLQIENHRENLEKFEACGIYLSMNDGLTYWTKQSFARALYEKRYDQNIITSQIDRMTEFAKNIEHFLRDFAHPTFNPEILHKQADELTTLLQEFRQKWGFPLIYKKHIYKGYKGRMCFIRYTDEEALKRLVEESIQKNKDVREKERTLRNNVYKLNDESEAKKNAAFRFYKLGNTYEERYKTGDYHSCHEYLPMAIETYMKAAALGHAEAQYRVATLTKEHATLPRDRDLALVYLRMAAYNHHADAQYELAEHYEKHLNNQEEALPWYEKAAENKHLDACLYLVDHYQNAKNTEKVIKHCNLLADNHPESLGKISLAGKIFMAEVCWKEKDYDGAMKWAMACPTTHKTLLIIGDCHYANGNFTDAAKQYQKVPVEHLSVKQQKFLADQMFHEGNYPLALQCYLKYEDTYPHIQIKRNIALCYWRLDKKEQALAICDAVLSSRKDTELAKIAADIYYDQENYEKALPYYILYTEDIYDTEVFRRMGKCYVELDMEQEACDSYAECLETIQECDELLRLAPMFMRCHMAEKAIVCYQRALEQEMGLSIPRDMANYLCENDQYAVLDRWYHDYQCVWEDAETLKKIGNYYFRMNEKQKAAEYYEAYHSAATLTDENVMLFLIDYYENQQNAPLQSTWNERLGDLYHEAHHDEEAVKRYEKCNPESLSAAKLMLIADTYFAKYNVSEALKWYDLRFEKEPDAVLASSIADKLWKIDEQTYAIAWYEKSFAIKADPTIARKIGNHYFKKDEKERSVEWYEHSVDLSDALDTEVLLFLAENSVENQKTQWSSLWNEKLGEHFYQEHDTEKALRYYEQCDPHVLSITKQKSIADFFFAQNQPSLANAWYTTCFENQKNADLAKQVADQFWKTSAQLYAIAWYTRYTEITHDAAVAQLIGDYYFQSNTKAAIDWYQKAIAFGQKPNEVTITRLGRYYQEYFQKYPISKKTLSSIKANIKWLWELGDILLKRNDTTGAIKLYIECDEMLTDPQRLYLVAEYYLNKGTLTKAATWYQRYFNQTRDYSALKKVADAFWEAEKIEKAIGWYEKSYAYNTDEEIAKRILDFHKQQNSPKTTFWLQKYGDVLLKQNKTAEAIAIYIQCDQEIVTCAKQLLVADYYCEQNNIALAEKWYKRCISSGGDNRVLENAADKLWKAGNQKDAIYFYKMFCNTNTHLRSKTVERVLEFYQNSQKNSEYWYWKEKLGDMLLEEEYPFIKKDPATTAKAAEIYMQCDSYISDPEKQKLVADYLFGKDDITNAIIWYQRYFAQSNDHKTAKNIADQLWQRDLHEEAIQLYNCWVPLIRKAAMSSQANLNIDTDLILMLGKHHLAKGMTDLAAEQLLFAAQLLSNTPVTSETNVPLLKNDHVILINKQHAFLKQNDEWHLLKTYYMKSFELIPSRLFSKGGSVLHLNDRAPKKWARDITLSENFKNDTVLHEALREYFTANHISVKVRE